MRRDDVLRYVTIAILSDLSNRNGKRVLRSVDPIRRSFVPVQSNIVRKTKREERATSKDDRKAES